jgi:hypothetical protein
MCKSISSIVLGPLSLLEMTHPKIVQPQAIAWSKIYPMVDILNAVYYMDRLNPKRVSLALSTRGESHV